MSIPSIPHSTQQAFVHAFETGFRKARSLAYSTGLQLVRHNTNSNTLFAAF
jgi:hypothetical protein